MASESSKKLIKSAAETAAKAAVEPIAKKIGEVITNKIFSSNDEPKIMKDKGSIV